MIRTLHLYPQAEIDVETVQVLHHSALRVIAVRGSSRAAFRGLVGRAFLCERDALAAGWEALDGARLLRELPVATLNPKRIAPASKISGGWWRNVA